MVGEQSNKRTVLKVIILGDGGVGKSSLMTRFVKNSFQEHCAHTVGVEFMKKNILVENQIYTLQIWDTAGQERFRTLRTPFYRGADICILVFALNDRKSFENLNLWLNEFVKYADVRNSLNFPFIVLGNKCDDVAEDRQISREEILNWCRQQGNLPYLETSAKDSVNVDLAFKESVKFLSVTNLRHAEVITYKDTINLQQKSPKKSFVFSSSNCC